MSSVKLTIHLQFFLTIYELEPVNKFSQNISLKNIVPMLNMSLIVLRRQESNCSSLIFRIYGATYPAVPHRTNKYLGYSAKVARLKSMILIYFFGVIRMFSGFRSRCSTPFFDMYRTALRIWRRITAISSLLDPVLLYFFF